MEKSFCESTPCFFFFFLTRKSLNLHLVIESVSILSSNGLTSFYLKHFCIEVEASLTGNEHLFGGYKRGLCSSSFPPPPHSLVTYCSLNKSAVFILCPAAKQLNGRAIDRAGSPLPPVCLCGELVLIWAHISVPGLYTRLRGSSFLQVYRQFDLHPVIMAQRYTHYVSEYAPLL